MAEGVWRDVGGIFGLILLLEEHRAAFDYDWRTRFHMPADAIGTTMPLDEAVRLVRILSGDPSSQIAAAMMGLEYPLERIGWVLSDIADILGSSNIKKWKAYRRPTKQLDVEMSRSGNAAGRTPEQVKAILATQFGQTA